MRARAPGAQRMAVPTWRTPLLRFLRLTSPCQRSETHWCGGAAPPHVGIVTAYNDMLSAHAPLQHYPDLIKAEARPQGATAQVAGAVPAMCDGVTQGFEGMELSLFSRDTIAMATAVA